MLKTLCTMIRLIGAVASVATCDAAYAQVYTVTDLGTLPGGTFSQAAALNSKGFAAGTTDTLTPAAHGSRAALFVPEIGPSLVLDLGLLPIAGAVGSEAFGINDAAEVVGDTTDSAGQPYAMLVAGPNAVTNDPSPVQLTPGLGQAYAINGGGVAAGWYVPVDSSARHAFAWYPSVPDGSSGSLADINGVTTSSSEARGINASGFVVGGAVFDSPALPPNPNGNMTAFLYNPLIVGPQIVLENLGTLGGPASEAYALNASNEVVGQSDVASGGGASIAHAFVWSNGKMSDLGDLQGSFGSGAFAINSAGEIVGTSFGNPALANSNRAVIFSVSGPTDLNTLISRFSGWTLLSANGVNDGGQIVGTGIHNGATRAFLLTPIRRPAPARAPGGIAVTP